VTDQQNSVYNDSKNHSKEEGQKAPSLKQQVMLDNGSGIV